MRKRLLRKAGTLFAIICCVLSLLFLYAICNLPVFPVGESYVFYAGASSSAARTVSDAPLRDKLLLCNVAGESAEYKGDLRRSLEERFCARLLFTEEVCGTVNYYYYSPSLGECVYLNGEAVNLHIAVKSGRTVAGTPIIFGGY